MAACVSLALGVAEPAHAEPEGFLSDYAAGKAALRANDFDKALTHFKASVQSAGDHQAAQWKGLIGIAYAFRGMGELGYALETYRRFLDDSSQHTKMLPPKWRARREAVQAEVTELENVALETHALATVTSSPPGARITVDGAPVGADGDATTPYALYVKPGSHTITITLKGFVAETRTLALSMGELIPVSVSLTSAKAATQPVVPPDAPPQDPSAPVTQDPGVAAGDASAPVTKDPGVAAGDGQVGIARTESVAGPSYGPYILLSTGAAAALTAVGLTVAAAMKHQDYERTALSHQDLYDKGKAYSGQEAVNAIEELQEIASERDDMQLASNVCYGVGVAAVVGGVVWLLVAEEPDAETDEATASKVPLLGVTPWGQGAMSTATWRF